MKTLLKFVLVSATLLASSAAFAAESVHLYLKLTSSSGKSRVVACPGGTCTLADLEPGAYSAIACDDHGTPLAPSAARHAVVTAREASSGMATGKRQHGAITITKEWGAASPQLAFTVSAAGTPVCLTVAAPPASTEVRESPTKASYDIKKATK